MDVRCIACDNASIDTACEDAWVRGEMGDVGVTTNHGHVEVSV